MRWWRLATDYDCWKRPTGGRASMRLLSEIIGNMHAATDNALALVKAALPRVWERRGEAFEAHRALELAIWTDKEAIPAEVKGRLGLLWGKYVQ